MKSILLTHSYYYKLDPKQWRFKQPYPPLGTLLIAAVIRKLGFKINFQDAGLKVNVQSIVEEIKKADTDYVIIYDDGFNYLTKMCLSTMREAAFKMIKAAKQSGSTVIVCNSDSSDHYEKYLAEGADFIVRGEGEQTMQELLNILEKREDASGVTGISYVESGKVRNNPGRPVLHDLDSLPLPAWDLVDMDAYRNIWMKHHGYFSLNVATTRGCPFKCNWCAKPIYGNRYNSRSPQHVLKEIEELLQNYKPDHFWMCDDIFGLKPGWVHEFDSLVKAKKLTLRYKIQSRADLLLKESMVKSLSSSGAETVWIGAESGSQKILDAMDKGTTLAQIDESTRLLKEHGIKVGFFLQFGYPGEQREDIDKTMQMILKLMPDEIGISISYPLPGTKFYDTVKKSLEQKQNWTDSDDLDMMFDGAYSSDFYKQLHRYIHSVYRKHRGYQYLRNFVKNPLQINYHDVKGALATFYYIPDSLFRLHRLNKSYLQEA
jgi:anaerobic magnesium-protoporphyrin IX monomethyl ester cyclase